MNYLIDMAVSVGDKRMAGMLKCYLNKPDIIKCNIIAAMFHRKAHSRFIDKLIMDVRNEADNYVKRTFNSDEEAQYKIVHNKALKALDRYKEAGCSNFAIVLFIVRNIGRLSYSPEYKPFTFK